MTRPEAKDEGDGDEDDNHQCRTWATEVTKEGSKVDPNHGVFQGEPQGALRLPRGNLNVARFRGGQGPE